MAGFLRDPRGSAIQYVRARRPSATAYRTTHRTIQPGVEVPLSSTNLVMLNRGDLFDTYAYKTLTPVAELWLTATIAFAEDYLDFVVENGVSGDLLRFYDANGNWESLSIQSISGVPRWRTRTAGSEFAIATRFSHIIEWHLLSNGTSLATEELFIDGSSQGASALIAFGNWTELRVGQIGLASNDIRRVVYFDKIKLGTVRRASDIFSATFDDGLVVPPFTGQVLTSSVSAPTRDQQTISRHVLTPSHRSRIDRRRRGKAIRVIPHFSNLESVERVVN